MAIDGARGLLLIYYISRAACMRVAAGVRPVVRLYVYDPLAVVRTLRVLWSILPL